jgi:hypothetical protein
VSGLPQRAHVDAEQLGPHVQGAGTAARCARELLGLREHGGRDGATARVPGAIAFRADAQERRELCLRQGQLVTQRSKGRGPVREVERLCARVRSYAHSAIVTRTSEVLSGGCSSAPGVVRQYSDGRANHHANEHVAAERHVRPSDDVDDSIAHERRLGTAYGDLTAGQWSHAALGRRGTAGTDERISAWTP